MTINQPADTDAAPPDTASGKAGTPRRRLIILASVVLALLAGVVAFAVTALSPPAAPAAHGTVRPLTGTGTGTLTLNLTTGAATADFSGHLSPLGAETGYDDLTFTLTGPSTFTYTGTRTFVAANGDKLFSEYHREGDAHPHHRNEHGNRHHHRRHRPLCRSQRDVYRHGQLRGRLGHLYQPDQPPHRCCPRTDPLLGQIDREGLSGRRWPQAGSETNPPGHPRPGGFGHDQAVHPHHPRGGASQVPYLAG